MRITASNVHFTRYLKPAFYLRDQISRWIAVFPTLAVRAFGNSPGGIGSGFMLFFKPGVLYGFFCRAVLLSEGKLSLRANVRFFR
jgi:hypothetical protein